MCPIPLLSKMPMGIKARDLCIWIALFIAMVMLVSGIVNIITDIYAFQIISRVTLVAYIIALIPLLKYQFYDMPKARHNSQQLGLKMVVLLPIPVSWGQLITGHRLNGQVVKAYELHLTDSRKRSNQQIIELLNSDLNKLAGMSELTNCLLLWETHVPIPIRYRNLLRRQRQLNKAVWEKGRWPIPSPPGTGKMLKKNKAHVRRAALIVPKMGGKDN